jgi:hypothetical protein
MTMILEAQLPLPRSVTSAELFSMGLHEHVKPGSESYRQDASSAEDEEILLCF